MPLCLTRVVINCDDRRAPMDFLTAWDVKLHYTSLEFLTME